MDSKANRITLQDQEHSAVDLSRIKPKYTSNSKSTLKNVLTEYGLQEDQGKRQQVQPFSCISFSTNRYIYTHIKFLELHFF